MEADFKYLLLKHGVEGARTVFEDACSKVLKKKHPALAFQVEPNPGDEGIDVFVGDFTELIEVYQCKFFITVIGDSQKSQIRSSFKTAVESTKYKMKKWVLCLPITLNIDEQGWWSKWKTEKEKEENLVIELWDSGDLLSLMRDYKVDEEVFDLDMQRQIREIHEQLIEKKKVITQVLSPPADIDYSESVFIAKLKSAKIEDHLEHYEKQFYNAEILEKETYSKGIRSEENEIESLKSLVHDLWLTQYLQYKKTENGNDLLGKVSQRIEDENDSKLKTILNANLLAKKGMLHQLANDCKLGWVDEYKKKITEYFNTKQND